MLASKISKTLMVLIDAIIRDVQKKHIGCTRV